MRALWLDLICSTIFFRVAVLVNVLVIQIPLSRGNSEWDSVDKNENGRQTRTCQAQECSSVGNQEDVYVYVLNLDERADRWACMRSQLEVSPYSVTRFKAATIWDFRNLCSTIQWPHDVDQVPGAAALFCTNYLLWMKLSENSSHNHDDDVILILEDDIVLKRDFWPRLRELLESKCRAWNLLSVDIFVRNETDDKPSHQSVIPCFKLDDCVCLRTVGEKEPIGQLDGEGAHVTIFRRFVVRKLLEFTETRVPVRLPLDHWYQLLSFDLSVRAFAWQPRLATQLGQWQTLPIDYSILPKACGESIESISRSNIRT